MTEDQALKRFLGAFGEAKKLRRGLKDIEDSEGVCRYYLSGIAAGRTRPTFRGALRLARAIGAGDGTGLREWFRRRVFPDVDVVELLAALPHPTAPEAILRVHRTLRKLTSDRKIAFREEDFQVDQGFQSEQEAFELLSSPVLQLRRLKSHPRRHTTPFLASVLHWLDDRHRFNWPAHASRLARAVALDLAPQAGCLETYLRAVAVLASSLRMRGSMTLAAMLLREVLPVAYRISPGFEARLIQRASYLLRDHAQHHTCLKATAEARGLYARVDDCEGEAKTIADKGICLYLRGDGEEAAGALRIALRWLPGSAGRYRVATHHGLGLVLFGQGKVGEGKEHITEAEQLLVNPTAYDRGSLAYTRANLARAMGDVATAEALYLENLAVADRFSPFDAALTTLDYLSLLVGQDRHRESADAGRRIHALMYPLRFHPDAQEALLELARLGRRITLDKIIHAQQAVKKARRVGTPQAAVSL